MGTGSSGAGNSAPKHSVCRQGSLPRHRGANSVFIMQQPIPAQTQHADQRDEMERADDELTAHLLISESPEGAPPLKRVRMRSLVAFSLVAAAVIIGVIGLLVFGGVASFGMGLVLCAI